VAIVLIELTALTRFPGAFVLSFFWSSGTENAFLSLGLADACSAPSAPNITCALWNLHFLTAPVQVTARAVSPGA